MFHFLKLKPEAFGLDISDLSLKIVSLKKRGGKIKLASVGETKLQEGIVRNGEVKNKEFLIKNIKKAIAEVKGKKINTKYVIASLPEEKAFLQVIQMPRILKEDLKSAVIFEAENYIPLPVEEVYLDSQIVDPLANRLEYYDVLISALPQKTVDPYVECLKAAGLKPLAFEIESLSVVRALVEKEKELSPLLLIDLGATRTSFIVFAGHSLRFTFSIPVSSQDFNKAVSREMKVSLAKAEELKIKYGLTEKIKLQIKNEESVKSAEKGKVFEALIPCLTDLTEQIKKYLNFCQSHSGHEHLSLNGQGIKKALLCGGGANLKGLSLFLSQQLELPVEIGNPWINVIKENEKAGISIEESLKYATAIGLALRGVQKNGY